MSEFLWSVFGFLLALGILVTFHEYGHFWTARRFGVKVTRFSIGFGRPIYKWISKKGIEYVIAWFPFGGYVKMLDEREQSVPEIQLHQTFNRQPIWIRTLIVLAGPAFNFLFAILAYWLVFSVGFSVLLPVLGKVDKTSIVGQAGLSHGDRLLEINHQPVQNWHQVNLALIRQLGQLNSLAITYSKFNTNQIQRTQLDLSNWNVKESMPDLLSGLGFVPYYPKIPTVIAKLVSDGPAAIAGLKINDKIIAVGGMKVKDWQDMTQQLKKYINKPVLLTLIRENHTLQVKVVPKAYKKLDGVVVGRIGIHSYPIVWPKNLQAEVRYPLGLAFLRAIQETAKMTKFTVIVLYKMVSGQISPRALSGPVGIAEGAGRSAQLGFSHFMRFLALISISLGLINLLPIPLLDGGHLLYYLIEVIKGKPLSEQAQLMGMKVGLLILLGFMALAISNDIFRLF